MKNKSSFHAQTWKFPLSLLLFAAMSSLGTHGQQMMQLVTDDDQPQMLNASLNWSYSNNGTDWNDWAQCNYSQSTYMRQSPMIMNVSEFGQRDMKDWSNDKFSFVANFKSAKIKNTNTSTYVYQLSLEDQNEGGFNGFWASEPKVMLHKYVEWVNTGIMFHYPAEHVWAVTHNSTNNSGGGGNNSSSNNATVEYVTADLEMQIYGYDINGVGVSCKNSRTSAMSLFFFLGEPTEQDDNTKQFFKFTEGKADTVGKDLDISLLVNYSTPMHYSISGYIGSLSQPPCTKAVCWYLIQRKYVITQKQLDFFKVQNVKSNARSAFLTPATKYNALRWNSPFGNNSQIVQPDSP